MSVKRTVKAMLFKVLEELGAYWIEITCRRMLLSIYLSEDEFELLSTRRIRLGKEKCTFMSLFFESIFSECLLNFFSSGGNDS